jgi:hypothetical protein
VAGRNTVTAPNVHYAITDEGVRLLEEICNVWNRGPDALRTHLEREEVRSFTGGSRGREIIPFPDKYVTEFYFDDWTHETFYVAKICGSPNRQNYREVTIWNQAYGGSDADLFAPIDVWDNDYRWIIMKRVTPVSPISGDLAYAQNGQQHYVDEDAPDRIEDWLAEEGWQVGDAPENIRFHEEQEYMCLFDYGGVQTIDGEITYPEVFHNTEDE